MHKTNQHDASLLQLWSEGELWHTTHDERCSHPSDAPAAAIDAPADVLHKTALFGAVKRVRLSGRTPVVALTFDLCEAPTEVCGYDGELVNILRETRTRATFFACGKWMRSHPERSLQLIADPLFEIGNHTWDHANLNTAGAEVIRQQITSTAAEYAGLRLELAKRAGEIGIGALLTAVPETLGTIRFPYGRFGGDALRIAAELGCQPIQWDVVTEDPDPLRTETAIVEEVMTWTSPGSIIIGHANGKGHSTSKAMREIIPGLRRRGFEFVTVSELLTLGVPELTDVGYERIPEDNVQYDKYGKRS